MQLILASASPRRQELLASLGLSFEVRPTDVDESSDNQGGPAVTAMELARRKAEHCANLYPEDIVLAADTLVAVQENQTWQILGKPEDEADAARMLSLLSGRAHTVITAYCFCSHAQKIFECDFVSTEVMFRTLDELEIAAYARSAECRDKAGAYALQGAAGAFVQSIAGSYSNVIGLPLAEVSCTLRRLGLWNPEEMLR